MISSANTVKTFGNASVPSFFKKKGGTEDKDFGHLQGFQSLIFSLWGVNEPQKALIDRSVFVRSL